MEFHAFAALASAFAIGGTGTVLPVVKPDLRQSILAFSYFSAMSWENIKHRRVLETVGH
jgi:hypothetical protein